MPVRWYVCPYDTVTHLGTVGRRPAVARHIPSIPNPEGALWDEAEILGNSIVVKVSAPAATLLLIDADVDFLNIPVDQPQIASNLRATIRGRLLALGYLLAEVSDTNYVATALLQLLTTGVSNVQVNGTGTGFVWDSSRRIAPKTVGEIERILPG